VELYKEAGEENNHARIGIFLSSRREFTPVITDFSCKIYYNG
jgi:hypothetical protein